MHPRQYTALLLFAIFLAFVWLQVPMLKSLSLQAVAASTICYFVIKKYTRAKLKHILPQENSAEMALVTFSLLLLVGNSGTLNSPLFPLTYIHLFFLVMSSSRSTAITVGPATALFHFGLEPTISLSNIGHLITIPIILLFFLFAREQHEEVIKEKQTIAQEEVLLTQCSKETRKLQDKLAKLEKDKNNQRSQLIEGRALLDQARQQITQWKQQYFACEPKALAEADDLNQQIDQAILLQPSVEEKTENELV